MSFERLIGPQLIPILTYFTIASITDIKHQKIYNWTSASLAYYNAWMFVVIPLLTKNWSTALDSVIGGALSFLVVIIPAMVFLIKAGGDIKFIGAAGLGLGGIGSILWILTSAILLFLYGKLKKKDGWTVIPFAPFLFAGLLLNIGAYYIFL